MKHLDLINKKLRERNEARAYIKNIDEEMLDYYRVFAKKIKPLPPERELSDFYHPSEIKKWRTIICCRGYRYCNICPIQIP